MAKRLRTRHASDAQSTGLLLWQVTNRWQAAQRAALKPFGLTHVQFVLLASLTWLDGNGHGNDHGDGTAGAGISQRRLAEQAATDPMMTSQVLRALEQRGLVSRAEDPEDGRARAVTVTPEGAELVNRALVAVEDVDEVFFAPVSSSALNALLASLRAGPGRP